MSTIELRASRVSKPGARFRGFARIACALRLVFEVLSEARLQAHEAKRRYPFTSW